MAQPRRRHIEESIISDLPTEILTNILLKVPVKTIVQCRCVCKSWYDLLSSLYFARLYLSMAPQFTNCLLVSTYAPANYSDKLTDILLYDLSSSDVSRREKNSTVSFKTRFNLRKDQFVGSCNGLLCISHENESYDYTEVLVCNPITREYIEIPGPGGVEKGWSSCREIVFGYSSKSNQYKILTVGFVTTKSHLGHIVCKGQILTVGSSSWRNIDVPIPVPFSPLDSPVINDAIHWPVNHHERDGLIIHELIIRSFDVENEQFRKFSGPEGYNPFSGPFLRALDGRLCLHKERGPQLEIWVMEEYGVKESWRKRYVFSASIYSGFELVTKKEDGCILGIRNCKTLVSYNPRTSKTKNPREVRIGSVNPSRLEVCLYTPNPFSLKDTLMIEDCAKVLNIKTRSSYSN